MAAKPKVIYGAIINLSGLFYNEPIKCIWDYEADCWCSRKFDFDIDTLGLKVSDWGCVTFSSTDRKEVAAWIQGARAATHMMRQWAHAGEGFEDEAKAKAPKKKAARKKKATRKRKVNHAS